MAKKIKKFHKKAAGHRSHKHFSKHSADKSFLPRVLALLYQTSASLKLNDILKRLGLPRSAKDSVEEILSLLCREGDAYKSSRKEYAIGKKHQLVESTIEKNPRGFGFATELLLASSKKPLQKDPFISAARMGNARHKDRVLIKILKVHRDGRSEAEVVAVLKRTTRQLAGFYLGGSKHGTVYPEDPRFPFAITLSSRPKVALNDGDAVIVRLLEDDKNYQPVRGEIVTVLGDPAKIEVQTRLVIEKFSLPHTFSPKAELEARNTIPVPGKNERDDLREILHVTIDGEDAKDFDDAIAVQKTRNGFRLYVSIADVSAYIKPGSILDQEAYGRGTSVYFPGTVIPMLPENISNNLCSLIPDEDRLAVTVTLDFDRQGGVRKKRFQRSIIRSHQRFTYHTVKQIIVDKDRAIRRNYKTFLTPLKWAAELAQELQKRRNERGSIGFSIPEPQIALANNGTVASISKTERNFAHQMIEEFMLAANEAVAETFTKNNLQTLYRIHEEPDPDKISDFVNFSATLGIKLPRTERNPAWYNYIINEVKGTPNEYIVNNLLLRTMQQARYSPENSGHFGLAAMDYTHFTSPIRRYPDLLIHRQLCRWINNPNPPRTLNLKKISPASSLKEAGLHLSSRERIAVSSERDMADRLKRQFMATKIGESFKAVISGVSENAFYVELEDVFVSGIISLYSLSDDYYILDAGRHRIIGDISAKIFQIGDQIEVVLVEVDQQQNRIHFRPK